MTAIDRVGGVPPGRPGVRSGARPGPGFLPPAEPAAASVRAAEVAAADPVTLDSLLALQQLGDAAERDRNARRHGQALLAALGQLQRALLDNGGQGVSLEQLRGLTAMRVEAADPGLAAAIDMVVLRARIELARRGF